MCVYLSVEWWVSPGFMCEQSVASQVESAYLLQRSVSPVNCFCGAVSTQHTYSIRTVRLLAWFDHASSENTPLPPPSRLEEHRLPLLHTPGVFSDVCVQNFASKLFSTADQGRCISWSPLQNFSFFQDYVPLRRSPGHWLWHSGQWRVPQFLQTQ